MKNKLKFKKKKNKEKTTEVKKDKKTWKIIIADDETEVHQITKLVLQNEDFEGRNFELLSSYSGEETKRLVKETKDVAVLFLDVVMESDDSGLEVVKYIRDKLHNYKLRIILRTGQPGQAPEYKVIRDYDINDYKQKTELTSDKLVTSTISALRAYRDLDTMEKSKDGLEKIIKGTTEVLEEETVKSFSNKIIKKISKIFTESSEIKVNSYIAEKVEKDYFILAGSGIYEEKVEEKVKIKSYRKNGNIFDLSKDRKDCYEIITTSKGEELFVYIEKDEGFNLIEEYLLSIFLYIIKINFKNIELIQRQKQIMKDLAVEREKSEISLRMKENFISNISHELRTPMTGLIGGLEILPEDLGGDVNRVVNVLKSSANRLEEVIEKLLLSSFIDKEDYLIEESKFCFKKIIRDIKQLLDEAFEKTNAKIKMSLDKNIKRIFYMGDELKIIHLIYFLMENAVKFTEDGEIKLEISQKSEKKKDSNIIKIVVSDTGIGMTENISKNAFDPFYQGEYYLTKEYVGTGISLTIVKNLVDILGGDIDFVTKKGKGTTFTVELPLKKLE